MRRRHRSAAGTLGLLLSALLFGIVLMFFPLRLTRAVPASKGSAAGGSSSIEPPKAGHVAEKASASASASAPPAISASPPASASASTEAPTLPTGKGLPLVVGTGVFFLDLKSFDDTKGEFECTTDLRLTWTDLRLRYPASESFKGYKEFRGKDAEEQLTKIWVPNVEVTNRLETQGYVGRRLRMFPDGRVELTTRTTGKYKTKVEPERFPFDRQILPLDMIVREDTTDEVVLRFSQEDVEFSHAAGTLALDGWRPGLVEMRAEIVAGWNGDRYSRAVGALAIDRIPSTGLAPIFIPLMASLLIPLLVLWMNRATEEGFEVEAFELANMGIGGLFSVIALSFAIYSAYGVLSGSDNTVTRLFGLNYATLALSLGIVVALFRYNLAHRWFGPYVNAQLFKFIAWALPVLTLATSIAFLLVAAA